MPPPSPKRHATPVPIETDNPVFTGAAGDRRIRLDALKDFEPEQAPTLTLAQILLNDYGVAGTDPKTGARVEFVLKPINLKAVAEMESTVSSLGVPLSEVGDQLRGKDLIKVLTILANQDLPIDKELTEDQVSRLVTVKSLPTLAAIVQELIRPLLDAPSTGATAAPRTGAASSGSAPRSSAGSPTR